MTLRLQSVTDLPPLMREQARRQLREHCGSVEIRLPWPPSVNHYWRHLSKGRSAGRVLISEEGRAFRKRVAAAVLEQCVQQVTCAAGYKLAVHIASHPPDKRARDLDNLPKSVLDSLKHAGVISDDKEIDDLRITREPVRPGGELVVRIEVVPDRTLEGQLWPLE